jgi:hypothetical protein
VQAFDNHYFSGRQTRPLKEYVFMDSTLKDLLAALKPVGTDYKKSKAGLSALQNLETFNGTSDARTLTLIELESVSDKLAKDAEVFTKLVKKASSAARAAATATVVTQSESKSGKV